MTSSVLLSLPRLLAVVLLVAVAVGATSTHAQEVDPHLPDPISTDQLMRWFGPLLSEPQGAWDKALLAHGEYVRAQLRLLHEEGEAWARAGEGTEHAEASLTPERERRRRLLVERIAAIDGQFFDRLAGIASPEVLPVVEWLRVHRQLVTCECGLDVQTQEVSFSLLSYSEVALGDTPLIWRSPQAAEALAAYDRRVLSSGRAFLKAHRKWVEARPTASEIEADSSSAPIRMREFQELMQVVDGQLSELEPDDAEEEPAGEDPTWQAHGAALALMGRRAHLQVEAALGPSARLLFRLRILVQAADLSDPMGQLTGPRVGSRQKLVTGGTLRSSVWEMHRLLDQSIDPLRGLPLDLPAIDAIADTVWTRGLGAMDQILRASRQRSDVQFGRRGPLDERQVSELERRRVAAVRALQPVVAEGLEAMNAVVAQAREIQASMDAATGPRGGAAEQGAVSRPASEGASSATLEGRLDTTDLDDSGTFDEAKLSEILDDVLRPPVTLDQIAVALGWRSASGRRDESIDDSGDGSSARGVPEEDVLVESERHALVRVMASLRADSLSEAWTVVEPLLPVLEAKDAMHGDHGAMDRVIGAILDVRAAVGAAEERLMEGLRTLSRGDHAEQRVRLLRLSTRFNRLQWPLEEAPEMTIPLVRARDLAGLLLAHIGSRPGEEAILAAAAKPLLSQEQELLTATERTGTAFLELGRAYLRWHALEDLRTAGALASQQKEFASALLAEIRLQRAVSEEMVAAVPPDWAARLRQAIAFAVVEGDLKSIGETERTPIDPRLWAGLDDAGRTGALVVAIEQERRRRLDAVLEAMIRTVLEHGSTFEDDWERQPTLHARLNRRLNRLRFEANEISTRADIALAAVLPPGDTRTKGIGYPRLIGRTLPVDESALIELMAVGVTGYPPR